MNIKQSVGLFTAFIAVIKFIFTIKGVISVTILLLLIVGIGSLHESIQQKTFEPFFREVGGQLLNFENKLYNSATKIEQQGGIQLQGNTWKDKILYVYKVSTVLFSFFSGLWILFTIIFVFYKIGLFISNYKPLVAFIIVIIILISFEMIGSLLILDEEFVIKEDISAIEKHLPLRGVIKTITTIPYIINPIYQNIRSGG